MHELLSFLTRWIANHPNLAGYVIFLSSFAESLAFVGLIMPGAALMLTAGVLVATGALSFWSTMAWAVGGAVLADGISFWLGHHFQGRIRSFSFFGRYPKILARGETFFHQHGGKSVFLGRFVGPVRPVIPLIAGMLGMGHTRFTVYNILSALGWAPAYLLPGMAFGASLALAGEVAGRLAVLLFFLMLISWLVFGLFRKGFLLGLSNVPQWEKKLVATISRSAILQHWLSGFLVKDAALLGPFTLLTFFFIAAVWLFLGITEDVVSGDPLLQSGRSLYHLLQGLRTPWGDTIMVALTMLGDAVVIVPLVLAAVLWLLWKKDRYSALFLTGTTVGSFLLVTIVKEVTRIPRPMDLYGGAVHWAFPSSHATMSLVIFGFLALLCSRELIAGRRWLPFALSLFLVITIGYSRLYLGAHWLSDVAGGFSLGAAWLTLMTIAYLHKKRPCSSHGLFPFVLLLFIFSALVHWSIGFADNKVRYQQQYKKGEMEAGIWRDCGWQEFPLHRLDMEGEEEQILNLQYAGTLPQLHRLLQQSGWQEPMPLTPASSLHWLMVNPVVGDLPLLPQAHDGRHEALLLIHTLPGEKKEFLALRLWPADSVLDNTTPLWVGTLSRMRIRHYLKLMYLPRSEEAVSPADLIPALSGADLLLKQAGNDPVLLIEERGK
ncbi:MAG: VTT domain-containing protein [Proteobacteria bacterium]|nr:VTT domain-containing protein [Pseudomonadota bacterium]MBU1058278.1 VTT domain-containing protein [Pseudomonadota bacterium]